MKKEIQKYFSSCVTNCLRAFVSLWFFFSAFNLSAQKKAVESDDAVEQKIENVTESINQDAASDKEIDYTTLLDNLNIYKEHPLDLNTATKDQLENLTLLNDLQVQALLDHIAKNGKLISLEELQSIDGFDLQTIYDILPFVKVDEGAANTKPDFKKMFTQGKSMLMIRYQQVLEEQKGFSPPDTSTNDTHRYNGSPAKFYTRYRYTFNDQFSFGLTGEKDAGEMFFQPSSIKFNEYRYNPFASMDFYSAHLFYRGNGLLKSIALGDFQAQYGQGLVLWSGVAFGKSADVMNIKKSGRGLVPYTSVDENLFMRGGAVSLAKDNFQLDLFYSAHKLDANVQASSDTLTQEDIISAFETDGNHRDSSELARKHSILKTMAGGHLQYSTRKFSVGLTGYSTKFDHDLVKAYQPYNTFDFSGNYNSNVGVDYNYVLGNANFFGEIGRSDNGGMGYLNGILASLDQNVSVSILHRHYDKNYQALESTALSENSNVMNEDGLYFGILLKPARSFTLSAYYDQFKFPWLRFSVDGPTAGKEYLAQLNYAPSKTFEAYFKIKQQNKPKNITADTHPISNQNDVKQVNYRFHVSYKATSSISLASRVEFVTYQTGNNTPEKGYTVYQDINFQPFKSKISFSARYALFDTDTYNTRIYVYESDVLYAYSIPSYYYRGSRFYITAHYRIMRGIDMWLRYGTTVYDNQKTVGSGLDEINGNQKSEVKAQVRFQF